MKYRWTISDERGSQTVEGDLSPDQVREMGTICAAIAVLREYRCTRGAERHWGEHTQAEIDALAADGWACEVGEPWPMESPAPPDQAAILAARAAEVLARDGATAAVQAVLARVGEVAAAGVAITDWSYQGVTAAIESAMTGDLAGDFALLRMGMALNTAWERVVMHAGTQANAYELWPAMVAAVQSV